MSGDIGTAHAERNDRWSQKIWREWTEKYNSDHPNQPCPENILQTATSPQELQPWLIRFITSFQEGQGTAYKPKTLYALLCHLHKHVKVFNPHHKSLRFLDRKNEDFQEFRDCLSRVNEHMEEFGIERRHYDSFTESDEEMLWSRKILGVESSIQLLHTIYFYNGKNLLLRRGEHQQLRFSQFRRLRSPDCYEFERIHVSESSSDQESEGFSPSAVAVPPKRNQRRKISHIMADPSAGTRCHVFLLDTYFGKIPPDALKKDHFYLQPVKGHLVHHQHWYTERPYGKNSLDKIAKCVAASGGLSGHFTATSLQQTGRNSTSSKVTHSYKSKSRQNSTSPFKSKKQKMDDTLKDDHIKIIKNMTTTPSTVTGTKENNSSLSTLRFSGEFLFSNTKVSFITEQTDTSSSSSSGTSGFQEIHMGDCSISIKPSSPVDLNVVTMLQGLEHGQWQVVMMHKKSEEHSSQQSAVDQTYSDVYSSEDDDNDDVYCPSPSNNDNNCIPPCTTIFQYVNN